MKLGEILIKRGLLKPHQLEAALKSQLILGGHIGTALIELGFLDENTLGDALSSISGIPYAPPQSFTKIPALTIAAVPPKIAEEYLAIPLKLEEKSVHLALANPTDLRIVDELSFAIGRRVIPWIAPEVRLYQALEEYYGVARRPRFITLANQLDEAAAELRKADHNASKGPAAPAAADEHVAADAPPDASPDASDLNFGYGKSWQEIAEELDRREASAPPAPAVRPSAPATPSPAPASRGPLTLPDLADRYCAADSHDEIARAALDFSIVRAERTLLLVVRGQRASIWHERGFALSNETRKLVGFDVTSEALFTLLMGDDYFHGNLPARDDVHSFYRNLRVEAPRELLLVPIRVNDLLVAVALADGGRNGRLHGDLKDFLKAFRLFGSALALLVMKRKLKDAARSDARVTIPQGHTS